MGPQSLPRGCPATVLGAEGLCFLPVRRMEEPSGGAAAGPGLKVQGRRLGLQFSGVSDHQRASPTLDHSADPGPHQNLLVSLVSFSTAQLVLVERALDFGNRCCGHFVQRMP